MGSVDKISEVESTIQSTLSTLDEQVKNYMQSLREISSHEILSGSLPKAQALISKIITIENKVNQLKSVHADFKEVVRDNGYHDENKTGQNKSRPETDKKSETQSSQKKSPFNTRFRLPILKALIYLGGNASTEDIIEYIKKEMKKFLTDEEKNLSDEDLYINWADELEKESGKMTKEKLVNYEAEKERWEILPEGIDYLAHNDS